MADQKISELTALTGANVADDDAIAIVDTSATETKKIVFSELKNALDTATGFVRISGDTMTGDLTVPNVIVSGNVDGRDVATDGTKLDGIAAGANVGIPATGGTMTGALDVQSTITSDGLTVDGDANLSAAAVNFDLDETDTTDLNTRFRQSAGQLFIQTLNDAKSLGSNRVNINHTTGDISLYEDTGTTAKFFWDASAESLGIGTSFPSAKIHSVDSNGNVLRLQRDGAFTGSWDVDIGSVTTGDFTIYDNENSQRAITVEKLTGFSGNSAVYIDSIGNVEIGTSLTPNGSSASSRFLTVAGSGDGVLQLTKTGSGGGAIASAAGTGMLFYTHTGTVGSETYNERMRITAGGHVIIPAGVTLGTSAGVYAAANTLDDYETGNWSIGVTVGGTAQTVLGAVANYTKIGDTVSIRFKVGFSKSGSGVVNITGLPFASGFGSTVSVPIGCQVNSVTSTAALFANIDAATTIVHLADQAGDLTDADFASTAYLFGSFTYQA